MVGNRGFAAEDRYWSAETSLKIGGEITTVLVSAIAGGALGLFVGLYAGFDYSYLLAALFAAVGALAAVVSARGRR